MQKDFFTADLVLTQLEIPMNVVEKTYEFSKKKYNKNWEFMLLQLPEFQKRF